MFGATISYALMTFSHIVLRRTEPDLERPYRTPGGAVTAGVALTLSVVAFLSTFLAQPNSGDLERAVLLGHDRLLLLSQPPPPRGQRA